MADFTGQHIGRYHVAERLGRGGMATVYRAHDERLDCEVAIKFLRADMLDTDEPEQFVKRFEREVKALARLNHPNIVTVTDYGDYQGAPYLVMKYMAGGALTQKIGKAMPWGEAARLLAPVARALEYAHQCQIIHRDIKPANILLTQMGAPMLSDFGVAKLLSDTEATKLTQTGMGLGTPHYMAPEQWLNRISPQTDIYALGVVFYELVTGHIPYEAETPGGVMLKHLNEPLPSPRQFVPGLPAAVEQVLLKALAKKPEDRYAGMSAMASALEALSVGELAAAAQTTVVVSAAPAALKMTGASAPAGVATPPPARPASGGFKPPTGGGGQSAGQYVRSTPLPSAAPAGSGGFKPPTGGQSAGQYDQPAPLPVARPASRGWVVGASLMLGLFLALVCGGGTLVFAWPYLNNLLAEATPTQASTLNLPSPGSTSQATQTLMPGNTAVASTFTPTAPASATSTATATATATLKPTRTWVPPTMTPLPTWTPVPTPTLVPTEVPTTPAPIITLPIIITRVPIITLIVPKKTLIIKP